MQQLLAEQLRGKPSQLAFSQIEAMLRKTPSAGVPFRECSPFGSPVRVYRVSRECRLLAYVSRAGRIEKLECVAPHFDQLSRQVEPRNRRAIERLYCAPLLEGESFDPVGLIRAANELIRLGKHNALKAVTELVQLASTDCLTELIYDYDENRIALVLMLAFFEPSTQPGFTVEPIGVPRGGMPRTIRDWPLFPLVLQDQMPFLVIFDYSTDGMWPSVRQMIEQLQAKGTIRRNEYCPLGTPIEAAHNLMGSHAWRVYEPVGEEAGAKQQLETMIRAQALRALMLDSVATRDPNSADGSYVRYINMAWDDASKLDAAPALQWDCREDRFVPVPPETKLGPLQK